MVRRARYYLVLLHQLFDAALADAVILGVLVMDDDRRSGLFRDQLVGGGEGHAEFGLNGGQEFKDLAVVFELGDGRIAPRVAFALPFAEAEFATDVAMQIFGGRFGSLHGEPMREIGFGVIALRLQRVEAPGGFLPDGHDLEGDHIHLA